VLFEISRQSSETHISGVFMVPNRIFRKPLTVWLAAAMAGALALTHAVARADGPPLILDTQTGIHDGQTGMVLQNAPLSHEPMVTARQPAGTAGGSSPTYIVVEPRIKAPGGGARSSSAGSSKSQSKSQSQSTSQPQSTSQSQSTSPAQ
jgi:hypothetical protein